MSVLVRPVCVPVRASPASGHFIVWDTNRAGELLDKAGDRRFSAQASQFRQDLVGVWAGQALYQGLMAALGYARNKLPFLEIARRLPLRMLDSVTWDKLPDAEWLSYRQALLLGAAGFLSSRQEELRRCPGLSDVRLTELRQLWAVLPHPDSLSLEVWHLLRVRPNNSPLLRLVAMSYLLLRYREKGWLEGLLNLVEEAPVGHDCHKSLEAGLVVAAEGAALLGPQRAADIVVNVLLPFSFAWSRSTAEADLAEKALVLYHLYPRLTVNSVEKRMITRLGLDSHQVDSARRQQGLLHIYKSFCSQDRCGDCPLCHPQSRYHI